MAFSEIKQTVLDPSQRNNLPFPILRLKLRRCWSR